MSKRSVPVGIGHYLPQKVVTNADFAEMIDTSDEWITTRTGIKQRHFAADGELTSDLGFKAAQAALRNGGFEPDDMDAILVATSTPDQTFPSTATRIQAKLGMTRGFAFDLQAVCAGFIFGLANADALIRSGQAKRVLLIGAETFSRILDFEDRATAVLFGDGAGALILEAQDSSGQNSDRGILNSCLFSDGNYNDILFVDGGVSDTQQAGKLRMQGKEVFKHAVNKLTDASIQALDGAGIDSAQLDWVVPHQANIRIIHSVAQKLKVPMDRLVQTVAQHGNTSAASIPLALSLAHSQGKIKRNDLILSEAIGGGLAWGAVVMRW